MANEGGFAGPRRISPGFRATSVRAVEARARVGGAGLGRGSQSGVLARRGQERTVGGGRVRQEGARRGRKGSGQSF
jgi:hypothetical protein